MAGVYGLVVVLAFATACGDEAAKNSATPPASPPYSARQVVATPPAAAAAPAIDATPAVLASPGSELKFPSVGIESTKLIGQTREAVIRELGEPNEDGIHERPSEHGVLVLYERGKAAGIEVFGTATGWSGFDVAQRAFVHEWFGTPSSDRIAGKRVTLGDSIDGESLGLYVTSSIPALKRIVAQRDEDQRRAVSDSMERAEAEGSVSQLVPRAIGHAEGDVLQVRSSQNNCDRGTLVALKQQLGRKRLRHFRSLACWTAGRTRDAIGAR